MVTIPSPQLATCTQVFFTEEEGGIFSSGPDVPIRIVYLEVVGEELKIF